MKSIAVFCGSSKGLDPIYIEAAERLGKVFAGRGIRLVYGGGNIGLMGVMADAILEKGGEVLGVIPHFLKEKEVCHTGLTELIVTETMHDRKKVISNHSDGFLVLPGGFGTLDEFFEILTWKQLHLHHKPIGILNINGYYDFLFNHINRMVVDGFVKGVNLDLFVISDDLEDLLENMKQSRHERVGKWVDRNLE